MLVQTLAVEAGPAGIRVNAVCPGDTAPGMATHVDGRAATGDTSGWALPPLARVGTGADVAAAVAFSSPDGAFCNGSLLLVDGGMRASLRASAVAADAGEHDEPVGLDGRVALVTGGTSGIGRACVARLRNEGMRVAFTGRSRERGDAVAAETGADFIDCDHRDRDASDRAVERALELGGGRLDVLVANAGILFRARSRRRRRPPFASPRGEPHGPLPCLAPLLRADA